MARLPVVGLNQLNMVRLSPAVKALLYRRSLADARRRTAGTIQPLLLDRQAIKGQLHQDVASARGATNLVESYLGQALRRAKGSGLKGAYLKQYTQALGARQAQAASAIPFLTADARATAQKDLLTNRENIINAKVATRQEAGQLYSSELGKAYTAGASYLSSKKSASGSGGLSDADRRKLEQAHIYTGQFLTAWKSNAKVPKTELKNGVKVTTQVPIRSEFPLKTHADLVAVAGQVANNGGTDITAALPIVEKLVPKFLAHQRRKKQRQTHQLLRGSPAQRINPGLQQLLGLGG